MGDTYWKTLSYKAALCERKSKWYGLKGYFPGSGKIAVSFLKGVPECNIVATMTSRVTILFGNSSTWFLGQTPHSPAYCTQLHQFSGLNQVCLTPGPEYHQLRHHPLRLRHPLELSCASSPGFFFCALDFFARMASRSSTWTVRLVLPARYPSGIRRCQKLCWMSGPFIVMKEP
jgi:hypothetical protein